jgi:hypothetical protein
MNKLSIKYFNEGDHNIEVVNDLYAESMIIFKCFCHLVNDKIFTSRTLDKLFHQIHNKVVFFEKYDDFSDLQTVISKKFTFQAFILDNLRKDPLLVDHHNTNIETLYNDLSKYFRIKNKLVHLQK